MNSSIRISPTVAGLRLVVNMVSPHLIAVIVQINVRRFTSPAIPSEDQPPLLVDADRMKARQIAAQLLEMIAGRHAQVLIGRRIVDHLELAEQPAFEIGRDFRERTSSTKKARNQSSRKPTIIPSLQLRVFVPPYNPSFKDDLQSFSRPLLRPPDWKRDRSQSALVCLESPSSGAASGRQGRSREAGAR